ncbi:MAG: excisionase family DNA-binding protein [Puniceicoccales bacterium]|jgi:excisionase family DNA binding protein|nr:excisionase family DNA-binding protein [Puniceicoccales bacterium]
MEVRKLSKKQNTEKWISIDTIGEYPDVSRETVLQWIDNKGTPAHKASGKWKFKISEVDEQIRSGEATGKE